MFERPLHQRIAQVLGALNGTLLKEHSCLFGGGTAIALMLKPLRKLPQYFFALMLNYGLKKYQIGTNLPPITKK